MTDIQQWSLGGEGIEYKYMNHWLLTIKCFGGNFKKDRTWAGPDGYTWLVS